MIHVEDMENYPQRSLTNTENMFEQILITLVLVLSVMEPSTTETSKNTIHSQRADSGKLPMTPTVRALLGVEAVSFFLAAMIHAGILIQGYEHQEAMIAESVIGTVLLVGLAMTWVRPKSMFSVSAIVQAFALVGSLIGLWTIIVGIGPRTIPDIVYHVAIIIVLVGGIVVAWHARGSEPI